MLTAVTDEDFAERVLANERPVLVDFWADWCPPCKLIAHTLAELAAEYGDRLVITKLNSDDNPRTNREYGVQSLPTLVVFQHGEVVGSLVGNRPKSALREWLDRYAAPR